jgi:hypothetical protein
MKIGFSLHLGASEEEEDSSGEESVQSRPYSNFSYEPAIILKDLGRGAAGSLSSLAGFFGLDNILGVGLGGGVEARCFTRCFAVFTADFTDGGAVLAGFIGDLAAATASLFAFFV